MKKLFYFIAVFFLFSLQYAAAQTGISYYKQAQETEKKAAALLPSGIEPSRQDQQKAAELYKAAAGDYLNARQKVKDLTNICAYQAYVAYVQAALQYEQLSDYDAAWKALKPALDLWQTPRDLSEKELGKSRIVTENSKSYNFNPAATSEQWNTSYYEGHAAAARILLDLGKQDDALKYAIELLNRPPEQGPVSIDPAYVAAAINSARAKNCAAATYAAIGMRTAKDSQPQGNSKSVERQQKELTSIIGYIKSGAEEKCFKVNELTIVATEVGELEGKWDYHATDALILGNMAFDQGGRYKDLALAMVNAAFIKGDVVAIELWVKRLKAQYSELNSADWKKLADLDGRMGRTEDEAYARKKAGKKGSAENTHVLVGINPLNLINHEYVASLDFMFPHVSHEFRFDYMQDSRKILEKDDKDKGNYYDPDPHPASIGDILYYSGYQGSYTLKFIKKDPGGYGYFYVGPQFRYTLRNYSGFENTPARKLDSGIAVGDTVSLNVSARSVIYAATFQIGKIYRIHWFYADVFMGVGLGYKTLETSSKDADLSQYKILDTRLKGERWNTTAVEVRMGFRVGIVL
jgi:hypothetical protein